MQINLKPIDTARLALAKTEKDLTANNVAIRQAETALQALQRRGASGSTLSTAQSRLSKLIQARGALLSQAEQQRLAIGTASDAILENQAPDRLVQALEAKFPIALLPARLETRFFKDNSELRIRIYPDQVHLDSHEPQLTEVESAAAKSYWLKRKQGEGQAAWNEIARSLGPGRAAWAVHTLEPTNDVFPQVELKSDSWSQPVQAAALPDRWVAVGYDVSGGRRTEIFRKWGRFVPDRLNVTPTPDANDPAVLPEGGLPLDEGMRWVVDYDEAVKKGMAITVTNGDMLVAGRSLSKGLDELVVLGVDWTLGADGSAARLAELLDHHQYSDGLSFIPPGAPTNNTGETRADFNSEPALMAASLDPQAALPTLDPGASAAPVTSGALGLAPGSLVRLPNAELSDNRTAALMFDALWESVPGYYLDRLLEPVLSDNTIGLIRDHAVHHLRPGGPLPALRVGRQPYGVLPVLSPGHFRPDRPDGFESRLAAILEQMRLYWRLGLGAVPHMGSSNNPDNDLLEILQMSPLGASARFRRILGPEAVANTTGMERFATLQDDILTYLIGWGVLAPIKRTRLAGLAADPQSHRLPVPFVQPAPLEKGKGVEPNYILSIAEQARRGRSGRDELNQHTDGDFLLQALLAHAALGELDRAGSTIVIDHLIKSGAITRQPPNVALRVGEQVNILPLAPPPAGAVRISTPRQQAGLILPAVTGNRTLADFISVEIRKPRAGEKPEFRNLASFLASLDGLAQVPADQLDRAFRGALDCFSYRLDAWYTSLATRRLQALRQAKPQGLYLGGYGWSMDVRPKDRPDSLGYIHAPSLSHATAAAILRSGNLSHQDSEHNTMNIDLSSDRVRLAQNLLQGVAKGQPLAALLGYRFERELRHRGLKMARFILPVRKLCPLRPATGSAQAIGSAESIAARDVVDGVTLLRRWREEKNAFLDKLSDQNPSQEERDNLVACLNQLLDLMDAASDLLLAEAVYQVAQGNMERAGAALAALDRQERPVEPEIVRTPRSGYGYQQRLLALIKDSALPTAWAGFPIDPRARAEPRLNAWIARLMGDPTRFRLAAQLTTLLPNGNPKTTPLEASLGELGLSPLGLVLLTASSGAGQPSELEERLAHLFAKKAAVPPGKDAELELLDRPPQGAAANIAGLGALRTLLDWVRDLITSARFADGRDLTLPHELGAPGINLTELRTRADQAAAAQDTALKKLDDTLKLPSPTRAALLAALEGASRAGAQAAVPRFFQAGGASDEEITRALADQAKTVLAAMTAARERRKASEKAFNEAAVTQPPELLAAAAHQIERLRSIFGAGLPVLPVFSAPNAPELAASLANRTALLGGDELAPLAWLHRLAPVRPATDKLLSVVNAAELLGAALPTVAWQVIQLPNAPGERWAGLPFAASGPPSAQVAILALGPFNPARPAAGLAIDAWSELVPFDTETTAVAFHYDAPGARPPQAILLATPPDMSQQNWTFETLLGTILEALDLATLRMVGPKQLPILGGPLLPAAYLPNNFSKDVASINFFTLLEKYPALVEATKVMGR